MLRDPGDPQEVWRAGRFEFALRYPYSNGWRPLIWGGVMVLLGFLVLPLFALFGYVYRVGRCAALGQERTVPAKGFLRLTWDGVRVTFLVLVYHLVFFTLAAAVLDPGVVEGEPTGPPEPHDVGDSQAAAVLLLTGLYLYSFPAYLTSFAATGSVPSTLFSLRTPRFLLGFRYLKAYLLQIPVVLLLYLVGVVMALTVIGLLFWIPLFYMVMASYWGRTYFDGVNRGQLPPPKM